VSNDHMRYDVMAREALRDVVRRALKRIAREGALPGKHHFYITFQTKAPGVDIDPELVEKYPEEMTIVLEHQFWDLSASEDAFEVTLKFGGVPKYISVPYVAITRFHDPSVQFALQFDNDTPIAKTAAKLNKTSNGAKKPAPKPEDEEPAAERKSDGGGEVVSLDSFRKNT